MRTLASLLAVAAVVAVAGAAAVDSFRGGPAAIPDDVRGELVYSDAACHRHAVGLPGLARRDFLTVGCGVFTRRDNLGVRDGAVSWFAYPVPGGTTTLLARGPGARGPGRADRRLARRAPLRRRARAGGPTDSVAGARRAQCRRERCLRGAALEPDGQLLRGLGGGSVSVLDRDGRPRWQTAGRAIAWSPDERYAAVAADGGLAIVRARDGVRVARLAVRASDVDWRRLAP